MDTPPSLAIVTVGFNTADRLAACIESLQPQLEPGDQIVVVDNASSDGSADLVADRFPDVHLIRSDTNDGFGVACNHGAAAVDSDAVLLFNSDAAARPGMLDALRAATLRRPLPHLLGGRSLNTRGELDRRSCFAAPTPWSMFCFMTGLSTVFKRTALFDPESIPGWERDTEREVDVVSGALMLVDRALWERLGGFDERYFMYGEDFDLCRRARDLGAVPTVIPDAVMIHEPGGSSTGAGKRTLLLRGKITAMVDHNGAVAGAAMRQMMIAGCGIRAALAAATRRSSTWRTVWPERDEWKNGFERR